MGDKMACKPTAERLLNQARQDTEALKAKGIHPHLAVVLVGENPASQVYVSNKVKTCGELGIASTFEKLPADTTTEALLALIQKLNGDDGVHGILVQLPLPEQIDESAIISAIDPDKDVDGFHPVNVGRLSLGEPGLFPCTPMGVIELLKDSIDVLKGKHAVVVGRSNIVGKPMAQLLLKEHCTVTIMHSRTQNPADVCGQADIIIAAVGVPGLVSGDWVKEGAVVVDVGINELTKEADVTRFCKEGSRKMKAFRKKGRILYGDVFYDEALEKAALVTPVPGGVGKLTIAHLMVNCVTAAKRKADV
ncbi:MAG: tetrahydrofolate dehydrogenase/cyclohydrolase catalytic domain-containing protein [Acidobacteriota bacterium]|nr:tetrahydrofolate dehydrogenase/cyclohydrolase catalytic domain-containing protein [Acidobacteriota bacterium]